MPHRLLRTECIYEGRIFRLTRNRVKLPNGRIARLDLIEHPGAVAVVPILDDGRVVLLHQFRLAARGEIWEIPAGTREPGEAPRITARRETIEETGWRPGRMIPLAKFYAAPGVSTEVMHVFLATGLRPGRTALEPYECIRPQAFPFDRAIRMIEEGKVCDAKSIIGLLRAKDYLSKRKGMRRMGALAANRS